MKTLFYIAFSIHGSKCFISASKKEDPANIFASGFVLATSRRPNYQTSDGVKLHHRDLLNKDDTPTVSAPKALRFFNRLEKEGWKIEGKDRFIKKHWKKSN